MTRPAIKLGHTRSIVLAGKPDTVKIRESALTEVSSNPVDSTALKARRYIAGTIALATSN